MLPHVATLFNYLLNNNHFRYRDVPYFCFSIDWLILCLHRFQHVLGYITAIPGYSIIPVQLVHLPWYQLTQQPWALRRAATVRNRTATYNYTTEEVLALKSPLSTYYVTERVNYRRMAITVGKRTRMLKRLKVGRWIFWSYRIFYIDTAWSISSLVQK